VVTDSVRVFAPAKINLFLHVGGKRADGYHALQSLVVFAQAGDELELHRSSEPALSLRGPFADGLGTDGDNLVLKAARLLERNANIVLTKNLPVASGIGGGSADAAAALRGLRELWNTDDSDDRLREFAAMIGSDVPVCIGSEPTWMEGRGEVLAPVPGVPAMPMLLVNPGIAVSTAEVFRTLMIRSGAGMDRPDAFRDAPDMLGFLHATNNDLEAPAAALQPVISGVLGSIAAQEGVLLTRMSGSGATCFGLFDREEFVRRAARTISATHPGWWVCATRIAQ
jgi:4-diphosphocytidyl-2-C-methyl-D-erythritol kinase